MARILVVEDDPTIQRLVRMVLEEEGHETEGAATAPEGLECLSGQFFDLLVLDLMLGPVSGWGLLREMERLGMRGHTKVIVLTARASERDILHGWRMGADDYVTKPFDTERFLDSVRETLQLTPQQLAARRTSELEKTEFLFRVQEAFAS
jgi:DNA-binding response OmpR family regulator